MGKVNNNDWRIDLVFKLFPFPESWPEELRKDYYEWLEAKCDRLLNNFADHMIQMILKGKDNG